MSVTATTIYNMALSRVAQGKIQLTTQLNNKGAEYGRLFYDVTRQYLLRKHTWGFAKKVEALALTTGTPFGWDYEYQIPNGCLRIRRILPEGGSDLVRTFVGGEMVYSPMVAAPIPSPYDKVGDKIWASIAEAYIEYTYDITDESMFDAGFVDLFAWKLAFELAMPLTGKYVLRDKMEAQYKTCLLEVTGIDANERNIPRSSAASQSDIVGARQ